MINLHLLRTSFIITAWLIITSVSNLAQADELKDISQLADQGQYDAALTRVNTYLANNPKDAQAMFTKGIILAESGRRDDAIKTFTDLTQKYPNLPEPYNNLAVLYADAGQYDLAKKALETAIKTHPSYAIAHENLGDIYARMASEAYDKALKLDNGNARAQSKLSLIKELFGSNNGNAVVAKNNSKSNTLPIRPADKKPEPPKPVEITKPADVAKPVEPVKPTETTEPVQTTAEPSNSTEEANIKTAVNNWAKAWASKNLDDYFASYADSFKPAKGENRKNWEATRKERIKRPSKISIDLEKESVKMINDNSASIRFIQNYRADGKPFRTSKELKLKKVGGNWLIDEEIANNWRSWNSNAVQIKTLCVSHSIL